MGKENNKSTKTPSSTAAAGGIDHQKKVVNNNKENDEAAATTAIDAASSQKEALTQDMKNLAIRDSEVNSTLLTPDEAARKELGESLFKCTGQFKRLVSPLLQYPVIISYLYQELQDCKETSGGSVGECHLAFAMRMEEPRTKDYMTNMQAKIRADPAVYSHDLLQDTWIIDFQNQVDYVPGLSKGKRILDLDTTAQYLVLGREMKASGNHAFAAMDFDMALTRYTQGVELLTNVECKDISHNEEMIALLGAFLTNQAIAALRIQAWRVAISACDACLDSNPQNLKARARRAEARTCLGDLDAAVEDLSWILAVKAEDVEDESLLRAAQRDARKAMAEIASLRREESQTARRMLAGAEFTAKRESEQKVIPLKNGSIEQPPLTMEEIHHFQQRNQAAATSRPVTEKLISVDKALEIQQDLVALYTSKEVQGELIEMRKASEYEDRRFIRRLRPYLIEILQEPIVQKHELGSGEEGYRKLELALGQHVSSSTQVRENAKYILGILMGDLMDD